MPLDDGDGAQLVAEVDLVDLAKVELVADDGEGRLVKATGTLSQAFDRLEPALGMIVSKLRHAARQPDEIKVDFGLKLGGETGLIFAKGTAEANLTISVSWKRDTAGASHDTNPA